MRGSRECSSAVLILLLPPFHSTDNTCVPSVGCVFVPDDSNVCNISDPCVVSPQCVSGTCQGQPRNCSAEISGEECRDPVCTAGVGCELEDITGRSCFFPDLCLEDLTVRSLAVEPSWR